MGKQGLYIHIPFCDRICRYCDFAKVYTDVFDHMKYASVLKNEYQLYQNKYVFDFDTVYFGGGTPSALSVPALEYLLQSFQEEIAKAKEITFEANPESLTEEKILLLKKYGVNRISLGVQTFNEKQLRFLNRLHTTKDIYHCFDLLHKYDFSNINLDLIYALPEQTLEDLVYDLEQIKLLKPTHISTYALIFEPHTALFLKMKEDKVQEVSDEKQEQMYQYLQKSLLEQGYNQYEFSNWALKSQISQHNTKYWKLTEYLGIGLGSHGFLQKNRYANTKSIIKYTELLENDQLPVIEMHQATTKELMEEMFFLGLRLTDGVSVRRFEETFGCSPFEIFKEPLENHLQQQNLVYEQGSIRLSSKALFISNEILSDFLLD